jgi:arachidonate 15-lipoxygenase
MVATDRSANRLTAASSGPGRFARDRALAANRKVYEWDHLPGLPPFCKGLPDREKTSRFKAEQMIYDLSTSLAESLLARRTFMQRLGRKTGELEAYDYLRPYGAAPSTAANWRSDEEFARQRLNGVNPLQIQRIDELPAHLAVDAERVAPVLPAGVTLAQLLDQGRLFMCDWQDMVDVPVTLGRFLTAPTALFWTNESGTLAPLAIQLDRDTTTPPETGQPGPPIVFTPADDPWLWLTARSHVQSADAAYHETVIHLLRTHLVMETVWVAVNRGLAPQHPIHQLLAPHFAGTIAINYKARNELIVPGGPIDSAISVGTEGAYWLINKGLQSFSFGDLDPVRDIERRQVADSDALGGYYYRDDALQVWDLIGNYVEEVLRAFYPDDAAVAADDELNAWCHELIDADCGAMQGIPLVDGRFQRFQDLHHVLRQVIFTVSAEHSAVNNGQYDIFGCITNSPGRCSFRTRPRLRPAAKASSPTLCRRSRLLKRRSLSCICCRTPQVHSLAIIRPTSFTITCPCG